MDKKRVGQIKEQFDLVIHSDENANIEFWYARELMSLLGYERWNNFDKAVSRAMDSCESGGIEVLTIFARSRKWFRWEVDHSGKSRTICLPVMPVI